MYDSDDPHEWVKNNAKALGIVGWLMRFIIELENLGLQPPQETKNEE